MYDVCELFGDFDVIVNNVVIDVIVLIDDVSVEVW